MIQDARWAEVDAGRFGLNWHGWDDWATRIETGGEFTCVLDANVERMRNVVELMRRSNGGRD